MSQRQRKRVEEPFGWIKTVGAGSKLHDRGKDRNRASFKMTTEVYNPIRITALDAATTWPTSHRGHHHVSLAIFLR